MLRVTCTPRSYDIRMKYKLEYIVVDPHFSLCVPTQNNKTHFWFVKNYIFIKIWSCHLLLFLFKRGNQVRKKNLKWLLTFGKVVSKKLEFRSKNQVTYWEGTSEEVAPLQALRKSLLTKGNMVINWLILGTRMG